jgi:hypothetical protein
MGWCIRSGYGERKVCILSQSPQRERVVGSAQHRNAIRCPFSGVSLSCFLSKKQDKFALL